jgi:hypothetical protein
MSEFILAEGGWVLKPVRASVTFQVGPLFIICCLSERSTGHCPNVRMADPSLILSQSKLLLHNDQK